MNPVTITVNNITSQIQGVLSPETIEAIDTACSFDVLGAQFTQTVQKGFWDGRKRLFSKRTNSFSTGLLQRVCSVLDQQQLPYNITDTRIVCQLDKPLPVNITPYDWQEPVIQKCLTERRGVIKIATGGGKSRIQIYLAAKLNRKTIIVVNKLDILLQFMEWIKADLGFEPGQIGAGIVNPKQITLLMVQTAAAAYRIKCEHLDTSDNNISGSNRALIAKTIEEAEVIIGDEVHGLIGETWYKLHKYFTNASYKLGFSATPGYTEAAHLLLEAAFGPQLVDITCSELIRKGYLTKPNIYFINFKHDRVSRDLSYAALYTQEVTENVNRNLLIATTAVNFWKAGRRILISVLHIKHGETLYEMLKKVVGPNEVVFAQGTTDMDDRRKALKDLNDGKIRLVIATKIFSEGVDVKHLDVLINCKAQISYIDYLQVVGRVLRTAPGKTKADIVDFYDYGCRYLTNHSRERMELMQREPEFNIKLIEADKIK